MSRWLLPPSDEKSISLTRGACRNVQPTVALTFDDGPWPDGTLPLLEVLGARGVRATFFVWGKQASTHHDVVRETLEAGHSVQPHCWEHRSQGDMTPQQIRTDIEQVMALLRELGAAPPHLWRPPWGNWLVGTTCELASERGLELAGWTIDTTDYDGTSASVMHRAAVAELEEADRSGSDAVVLMHDSPVEAGQWDRRRDVGETVELVRRLVADESRRFVPLSHGLWTNLVPTSSRA